MANSDINQNSRDLSSKLPPFNNTSIDQNMELPTASLLRL
jgi:hypothetical protein